MSLRVSALPYIRGPQTLELADTFRILKQHNGCNNKMAARRGGVSYKMVATTELWWLLLPKKRFKKSTQAIISQAVNQKLYQAKA